MAQAAGWKWKTVAPAGRVGKRLMAALILFGLLLLLTESSAIRRSFGSDWNFDKFTTTQDSATSTTTRKSLDNFLYN